MKGKATEASVNDRYTQRKSLVPVLYDWLANHNLVWPSLSCRWGPQLEQATYKSRQRLFRSEQTDSSVPNTLVIANCEVVKPRVAAAEHISQWSPHKPSVFGSSAEDGLLNIWDHEKVSKNGSKLSNAPSGLFFRHAGHRDKVVDFHWNVSDPWTIASVSDDCGSTGGGVHSRYGG